MKRGFDMKKNAFTMVELLAVIIILGLITMLTIPKVMEIIQKNKTKAYENQINKIEQSADLYAADNSFDLIFVDGEAIVTLKQLIDGGYIEGPVINAKTDKEINETTTGVRITKTGKVYKFNIVFKLAVIPPSICFNFNAGTGSIVGYDSTNVKCPLQIIIPSKINDVTVTRIGAGAFQSQGITKVIIPPSVAAIETRAFQYNEITDLTLSSGLVTIGEAAFLSNLIKNINIPPTVTDIGKLTFSKNKLESLILPATVRNLGVGAFVDNLLPDEQAFISYRSNGYTASYYLNSYGGAKRNGIVIPSNFQTLGDHSFQGLNIENINLPPTVIEFGYAVFDKNLLTTITIPNGVTIITQNSFSNNRLTTISIPNTVQYIYPSAFYNNLLKTVTIPSVTKRIDNYAFSGNPLEKIIFGNATTVFSKYMLHYGNSTLVTAYETGGAGTYIGSQYGDWTKQ